MSTTTYWPLVDLIFLGFSFLEYLEPCAEKYHKVEATNEWDRSA